MRGASEVSTSQGWVTDGLSQRTFTSEDFRTKNGGVALRVLKGRHRSHRRGAFTGLHGVSVPYFRFGS